MFMIAISAISCILVSFLAVATIVYGGKAFQNKDSIITNDDLVIESKIINNKNKKGWKYGFKKY